MVIHLRFFFKNHNEIKREYDYPSDIGVSSFITLRATIPARKRGS